MFSTRNPMLSMHIIHEIMEQNNYQRQTGPCTTLSPMTENHLKSLSQLLFYLQVELRLKSHYYYAFLYLSLHQTHVLSGHHEMMKVCTSKY